MLKDYTGLCLYVKRGLQLRQSSLSIDLSLLGAVIQSRWI